MFTIMKEAPAPTGMMLGYARVSTDDQDLSLQRRDLIRYGVPEDCIYEDHGISGARWSRPGLDRLMKHKRRGDTVVVWKLDRLGRTLAGIIETVGAIVDDGANFASVTEQIDTTTAMGTAFFHMMATFAQLERDLISERTRAGIAVRKAAGAKFGRPGYIKHYPKRLEAIRPFFESGAIERGEITAGEALAILNAADRKAPKIKSPGVWYRWLKDGAPGVDG